LGDAVDYWKKEAANSGPGLFFHHYPLENSSLHGYLSNWPTGFCLIHRAATAAIYVRGVIQT
jgi:hypothetical protein